MSLASYFSKDVLAIHQAMNKGSIEQFEEILTRTIVQISYDINASTSEGIATLDMLVSLFSRLYPNIQFHNIDNTVVGDLETKAKNINANITITSSQAPTVVIVVGKSAVSVNTSVPVFYIGSDNWTGRLSTSGPVGSTDAGNIFSAGVIGCLAAANVFRFVFRELLEKVEADSQIEINLLDLHITGVVPKEIPVLGNIDVGKVHIVGLGAIGNGVIWALSKLRGHGEVTLIDHETISLSNLQRYVCATEQDVNLNKTELAAAQLTLTGFKTIVQTKTWSTYKQETKAKEEAVIVGVDSAKDRIGIQSSLPRVIFNGFTENGISGITKHFDFTSSACLCCGFIPEKKGIDKSQEVANNLGIGGLENQVRHYIYYDFPVDDQLINWIAEANGISKVELEQFLNIQFSKFYSDAVCGGILLSMKKTEGRPVTMEAPLAFQSSLVGVILASQFALSRIGISSTASPNSFQYYPLKAIKSGINPYSTELSKDKSGRCICTDDDYLKVYKSKWQ